MDRHTPQQRSFNMSQVRSRNTKPELFIFSVLDNLSVSYEKHYKILGRPDIAFPEKRVAVFVNGEFWHGRNYKSESGSYPEFWKNKIGENIKRDRKNYKLLKVEGWKVIKLWDKNIKKHSVREINKILRSIGAQTIRRTDLKI